jgi:hypothetical protein
MFCAPLKRIPNGFGIPNPELLNPDLGTGFVICKSGGIGIGIPLGNDLPTFLDCFNEELAFQRKKITHRQC